VRETVPRDLGDLSTEGHLDGLADLDRRPTLDVVLALNEEDHRVAPAVGVAAEAIAAAVDAIVEQLRAGGRVVYVGAGAAGGAAVLDASEWGPTFDTGDQVVALLAGAATGDVEAAEDDADAGREDVRAADVGPRDVVVAVSASGRTPYALGAVEVAAGAGARTVCVVCNEGSPLAAAVDLPIVVVVGPEVITGSSRLKAGTAQKLVLNTLSTAAMVRLGRTYGNLMVAMRVRNEKLEDRAVRLACLASGAPRPEAEAAVRASGGDLRTAVVMLVGGLDAAEARLRLAAAGGVVRDALRSPERRA
jgi:N-acetylmuramic acid 6-phosphate etherase